MTFDYLYYKHIENMILNWKNIAQKLQFLLYFWYQKCSLGGSI